MQRALLQVPQKASSSRLLLRTAQRYLSDVSTPQRTLRNGKRRPRNSRENELLKSNTSKYPMLLAPDYVHDPHTYAEHPPDEHSPYRREVVISNEDSVYRTMMRGGIPDEPPKKRDDGTYEPLPPLAEEDMGRGKSDEVTDFTELLPIRYEKRKKLMRFNLLKRSVSHQTGKGKIRRLYVLTVVGNGNGMVGYGEAKNAESYQKAGEKAYIEAVRNLDAVERFEDRTIFTEMRSKLGACQILLRPRPPGFGLMCNPFIHQVLKAAGFKDISAKVWGSRNPLMVIKTLFRMIQSGHQPQAMGDGIGGRGRKLDKGHSIITRDAVERARGRKLSDLRL